MDTAVTFRQRSSPPAVNDGEPQAVRQVQWGRFLIIPGIVSFALLILPQAAFVSLSLHKDLALGAVADELSFSNYLTIFTDAFYLRSIGLTFYLSAVTTIVAVGIGFPTAYAFARFSNWAARLSLSLVLTTSLVTIVIKIMGLNMLLQSTGLVNGMLLYLRIISAPLALINNDVGVIIGQVQYTLPIVIITLFGVMQTIPIYLEEAAEVHGASRTIIFIFVIIPVARVGLISSGLIAFNMSMGAFTSAMLLGGGHVQIMPVLIQEKIIQSAEYGMGAALSTVLLVFVFLVNMTVGLGLSRLGRRPEARP
jgi:putative spermidine/putrescine transport system permease protein